MQYGYDAMNNRSSIRLYDPQETLRRSLPMAFNKTSDASWPGLLWRIQDPVSPSSLFTEMSYDGNRNLSSLTDPDGGVTQFLYDPLNRLSRTTQVGSGGNLVTAYTYDLQGALTSVTDAERRVTSFETDDLGRVTKAVSPDTGTTRYAHDAAGNLRRRRTPP